MEQSRSSILNVYTPNRGREEKPTERLVALVEERDRSLNYLVIEAITQYVAKEES